MKHIITMSGSSKRFISKGYPHKALLNVNGKSSLRKFIELIGDFDLHENLFLCRDADLESLRPHLGDYNFVGIPTNEKGPLYSLSNVWNLIDDSEPLLITYIDAIQKFYVSDLIKAFDGVAGGLTSHGLKHPHWRNNQYYCFVRHDDEFYCQEVIEKYNFNNIFVDSSVPFDSLGLGADYVSQPPLKNCGGSKETYYFESGDIFKKYSSDLMEKKKTVNGEYYVTQIFQEMISDGLEVKAYDCPYVSFGIPEDVEDYIFWENWFEASSS